VEFSSWWSIALTWEAKTCRTLGFVENLSGSDVQDLLYLLKHTSHEMYHPFYLPELILHLIVVYLNDRIRIPESNKFFDLERSTGFSRYQDDAHPWDWPETVFQQATRDLNKFNIVLTYLDRRFNFALELGRLLHDSLETLPELLEGEVRSRMTRTAWEMKERLENTMRLLKGYEHQVQCMQKRSSNITSAVRRASSLYLGRYHLPSYLHG
jgi:hypothetical protein